MRGLQARIICALLLPALWGNAPALAQTSKEQRGVGVVQTDTPIAVPRGSNWLVLIAINDYIHVTPLAAPVKDVQEFKRVLLERYAFDQEHTIELLNEQATLSGIYELFKQLAKKVKPRDSVLIYYAGHGHFDELTNTGYWIPYDGGTEFGQNWLVDTAVQGTLRSLKAKHALIIADSCFSGNLLNQSRSIGSEPEIVETRYRRAYEFNSRMVLTSGNLEPVEDASYGNHSAFAYHLSRTLEQNDRPYFDAEDIHYRVRAGVEGQQPLLGSLKGAGHQLGGSYIFFLKDAPLPGGPLKPREEKPEQYRPVAAAIDLEPDPAPRFAAVLQRWEEAYEALDFAKLREIWPSCPWTERTFGNLKGFEIEIPPDSIEVHASGIYAKVSCLVRIAPVGGRRKQWKEYRANFEMENRNGAGWRILDHEVESD